MSPLVRACTAAAVLAGLATAVDRELEPVLLQNRVRSSAPLNTGSLLRPCPPKTLLDNQVCVPAPNLGSDANPGSPTRNWQIYDRLPRRPDRPASYDAYSFPVAMDSALPSPFLLESQAEGDALLLTARLGAPITLRPLQDQRGTAAVIYAGQLVGKSVVTEHRVSEAGREQVYLVIYGNLASVATRAGVELKAESKLGTVGSSASGHAVGLHLEVRRVRHAVDPRQLAPEQFRERAQTVACDARNVFPLKTPRGTLK